MLRVTIVGCGKIADQHVHAIRRIPDCSVVAVCDQEPLMAQQLAERFKIPSVFSNAQEMLKAVSPDVVHITTPPQSHYTLARECLEAGSHVYLEKPITVTGEEAESLVELAEHKNIMFFDDPTPPLTYTLSHTPTPYDAPRLNALV